MTIANTEDVYVELSVLQKDLPKLEVGQTLSFETQGGGSSTYEAKVVRFEKIMTPEKMATVHTKIITKSDILLLPGMTVKAQITIDNESMPALPRSAVAKQENDWYALKLLKMTDSNYSFKPVVVELGDNYKDFIAIKNLASDGSQYLVRGAYFVMQ